VRVRVAELMRRLDSLVLPPLARAMTRVAQGPGRLRLLSAVALVSATAVLVTAVWAAERRPAGRAPGGAYVAVDVGSGDSAAGYEQQARAELEQLRAQKSAAAPYALVSFGAYLAPDRLRVVLAGSAVSEVFARVPLATMKTQIVRIPAQRIPDDVVAGMQLFAERKDREAVGFQERANQATDEAQRQAYEDSARAALAEATAYRSQCSCVYAAVVRAGAEALGELAERPGVRTVDPAPEVQQLELARFRPPLPEQTGDVTPAPVATGPSGPPLSLHPPVPAGAPATEPSPAPEPVATATSPEPTDPPPSPGPEPSAVGSSPDPAPSPG
jgi:hypothetical protein